VHEVVGEVAGRVCVIVDDMIDTAGTITKAADALFDKGATRSSSAPPTASSASRRSTA
jgi:ribose-phosphate pyrophosphokinase